MDLIEWFQGCCAAIPTRSDLPFKAPALTADRPTLPDRLQTDAIRALSYSRSPGSGAISIEGVLLAAEKPALRALGLMFIAYALSVPAIG